MNQTNISWATTTWNPIHGCSKVSPGCDRCYAETLSLRRGWTKLPWTGANAAENVKVKPHKLREPYKLKEPSRVFVNSMSDMFHPIIPDDYIAQVFAVMNDLQQHVFQILTKRLGVLRNGRANGLKTSGKARPLKALNTFIGSTNSENAKQRLGFYRLNPC